MRNLKILALFVVSAFCTHTLIGQNWETVGSGTNGKVNALTEYNGNLIAGGIFDSAGVVNAKCVASWNGTSWAPMDSGFGPGFPNSNEVNALITFNDTLYAGGFILASGSNTVEWIARWNGSTWEQVGNELDYPVNALEVYQNELYAGGQFTGNNILRVAKWNGSSWGTVDTNSFNDEVYDLEVYKGELYAVGEFTMNGSQSFSYIAKWDGTAWSDVGGGLDNPATELAVHDDTLYAGGDFSTAGTVAANKIAKWDGTTWYTVGNGLPGAVTALGSFNGNLYVCGNFFSPGFGIVRWDGSSWSSVAGGIYMPHDLQVYSSELYAGGSFSNKKFIAKLTSSTAIQEQHDAHAVKVYPNPFNEETILYIFPFREGQIVTLYNLLGDRVRQVSITAQQTIIKREGLPNGIYFYQVTNGSQKLATGKLIIH